MEVGYFIDVFQNKWFDTIYHEHLSFFGMHSMKYLVEEHKMEIFRYDYFADIHGGTIRFYIGHKDQHSVSPSVDDALVKEKEEGFTAINIYAEFASRVYQNKKEFIHLTTTNHC